MSTDVDVTIRSLRSQARRWRHRRAGISLGARASELYTSILAVVILGAMGISALLRVRSDVAASCSGPSCQDARDSLVVVAAIGTVAVTLAVLRAVGPVLVAPATATWLLSSPLDRRPLLRSRSFAAAAAAVCCCAGPVAVAALAAGLAPGPLTVLTTAAGLAGVIAASVTTASQSTGSRWTTVAAGVLMIVAWSWLVVLSLGAAPPIRLSGLGGLPAWSGLAALVAVSAWSGQLGIRALTRLRRTDLVVGGSLVAAASGALVSLDVLLAHDVLVARRWVARASVRSVRSGPRGAWAVAWRDVVRLRRSPVAVIVLVATTVVPYTARQLELPGLIAPLGAVGAALAAVGLCGGLRITAQSPGLTRCLALTTTMVRCASLMVPAVLLLVWAIAIAPAMAASMSTSLLLALAVSITALASAARWLLSPAPDYGRPLIATPIGAVPTGVTASLLCGPDLLAVCVVVLMVAPTAVGAMIASLIAGATLAATIRQP